MRETLIDKLRPDRFTAVSGKMAAIVGYVLGLDGGQASLAVH